jgi:hypothetical protein
MVEVPAHRIILVSRWLIEQRLQEVDCDLGKKAGTNFEKKNCVGEMESPSGARK